MKRKEYLIRAICCVAGVIIGMSAVIGGGHIKEAYHNKLLYGGQKRIEAFSEEKFWDKVSFYFEDEMQTFLNNYYSIYSNFLLNDYLDDALKPYYDKYGVSAILCSGLTSGNKMAEAYCVEKCNEMYGDEKLDIAKILQALNTVKIDEKIMTNNEEEQEYIDFASERLELAKAIFSGNFEHKGISKSDNGKRMAWCASAFFDNYKLRIMDSGQYYTLDTETIALTDELRFLSDLVLLREIKGEIYSLQFVSFSEKLLITNLDDAVQRYFNEKDNTDEYVWTEDVKKLSCKDFTVSGECKVDDRNYKFTLDARKGEILTMERIGAQ